MSTNTDSLKNALTRIAADGSAPTIPQDFLAHRGAWVRSIVDSYLSYNVPPSKGVADVVKKANLNEEQTKRMIEDVNVELFLTLFKKSKGNDVRKVEFPVADLDQVNAMTGKLKADNVDYEGIIDPTTKLNPDVAGVAKEASDKSADPYAVTNSISMLDNYEDAQREYAMRKLASVVKSTLEKRSHLVVMAENALDKVATTLVRAERTQGDGAAQAVFNKLASDLDLRDDVVDSIISKTASCVDYMKASRRLPTNFDLSISSPVKANKVGLGDLSLQKLAEDTVIRLEATPEGIDYNKLISILANANNNLQTVDNIDNSLAAVEPKAVDTNVKKQQ